MANRTARSDDRFFYAVLDGCFWRCCPVSANRALFQALGLIALLLLIAAPAAAEATPEATPEATANVGVFSDAVFAAQVARNMDPYIVSIPLALAGLLLVVLMAAAVLNVILGSDQA